MDMGGAATAAISEEQQLGQVVQAARKRAGLTQQGLCQRSGLSYSTLAKIERGAIKSPSIFTIQHIAATLGIGLDQLMGDVSTAPALPVASSKKVSKSGVRFVYFDMNGCLVRAAVTKAATMLSADSGVTPDVIESIFWQYDGRICRGEISIDELNTALAQRLEMMVDWNKYYLAAVEPTPQIAELVEWVSQNYHIGIITNTQPGLVEPMLQNRVLPSVHYDVIVQSCEVHAVKPEPRIFEVAAERAGVSPNELLLIDDDKANLSGAAQLGWHTLSFDPFQPEQSVVAISTALQPADDEPMASSSQRPNSSPNQPAITLAQPISQA